MARSRVLLCAASAVALVSGLVALPAASAAPLAKAKCTIMGTSGDDVLRGTPGDDVICGLRGSDVLIGLGGDDVLRGGPGHDALFGDGLKGKDTGDDTLMGGPGRDNIEPLGKPYCAPDCSGLDLDFEAWVAQDLTGIDFTGSTLRHAILYLSNLRAVNFTGTDLTGANIQRINYYEINWSDATCPDGLKGPYPCKQAISPRNTAATP